MMIRTEDVGCAYERFAKTSPPMAKSSFFVVAAVDSCLVGELKSEETSHRNLVHGGLILSGESKSEFS